MAFADSIGLSKLDLSGGTHTFREEDYPLATGVALSEEGQCMVLIDGGSVQPSAAAANERFVGFSKLDDLAITTWKDVEELTVPAVAPFTVTLAERNLVAGQIRIRDITNGVALTEVGGAPAATQYSVVDATGVITFNLAEAGVSVRIWYAYDLSAAQFQQRFGGRHINQGGHGIIDRVTILRGPGRVRTMQYNVTAVYEGSGAEPVQVTSGAGGLVTVGGAGDVIGYVIKAPSAGDPYLTLEMSPA